MSRSEPSSRGESAPVRRAVALRYGIDDAAPIVVASGMGCLAEKILDVARENDVPVYEDNSLSTILSRLNLGQEIPEDLYRAIVEIYIYFLNFDPARQDGRSEDPHTPPASAGILDDKDKGESI